MSRLEHTKEYPLSFGQERLWFEEQLQPGTATLNVPYCFRVRGQLDERAFESALHEIVERYEILRTVFRDAAGTTVQVVQGAHGKIFEFLDYSELPESGRWGNSLSLALDDATRPFDLHNGPIVRARIVRLSQDDHLLSLTFHHIIIDGWSMVIFFKELAHFYDAQRTARPSPLPAVQLQYGDFAVWQRENQQNEALDRQLKYWKENLSGKLPVLDLPTDHVRPPVRGSRGALFVLALNATITEKMRRLSSHSHVTPFMFLLGAFNVFLHRYTGQSDILVGTPLSGRTRREAEDVIGYFVNTLVLRNSLAEDPVFLDFLKNVRDVSLNAIVNQDVPLEKLMEEVGPERDLSRTALFQALFTYNPTDRLITLPGVSLTRIPIDTSTTKVDLYLDIIEEEKGLLCNFEYSTDLFESETIRRWAENFQCLVEGIVADPSRRVSALPIMSRGERDLLLKKWGGRITHYPRTSCVHELFERQAVENSHRVALEMGDDQVRYGDLNARANRLAHFLRKRGVTAGMPVGLCIERSVHAIVAMLGILKAGGTYVPLDPSYPLERVQFMIDDAQTKTIVSLALHRALLPDVETIFLDSDAEEIEKESVENMGVSTDATLPVYIMYTSGSSGTPKGVVIPHRGVVRLVKGTTYADFARDNTFLQFAPLAFDASTFEIWGSLLNGARIVIAPTQVQSLGEISNLIQTKGITMLWLTAGLFNSMVDECLSCFANVKQLLAGGDVLSPVHVERFKRRYPAVRLVNGYGPTENTTFTCCHEIKDESEGSIPIGKPIPNTSVYILDSHLNLVPVGVVGELCIGGDGLSSGYLNRPDLTSESFIVNPLGRDSADRLYRSGDLARYRSDGTILFEGRADTQVKIRGFRIELGEVESALAQHPSVREVVVVAEGTDTGEKKLTAYCVCKGDDRLTTADLRSDLKKRLPEYMVPSAFVFLDALPLTEHGKVDRKRLPAPDASSPSHSGDFVAPEDPLQRQLAGIWERVLNRTPIGVTDNFFELGGHSLLAFRLFAEIERELGQYLPLVTLFQAPTVEGLATIIRQKGWRPHWSCLVSIQPQGARLPIFFVHGVGGNILNFHDLAHHLHPDQPVYGLQSLGLDGKEAPLFRVEDMAARYIKEIRELQPRGPYCLGGMSFGGAVAFEMARQLVSSGEIVALLALLDSFVVTDSIDRLEKLRNWILMFGRRVRHHAAKLVKLPAREKIGYFRRSGKTLMRRMRSRYWQLTYNLEQPEEPTVTEVLRNVRESNYLAARKYEAHPYEGTATLFLAENRGIEGLSDPVEQWNSLVRGGVRAITVPGDHVTMVSEPHVRVLAQRLDECLAEVNISLRLRMPEQSQFQ